jgi:hypothetical protein
MKAGNEGGEGHEGHEGAEGHVLTGNWAVGLARFSQKLLNRVARLRHF